MDVVVGEGGLRGEYIPQERILVRDQWQRLGELSLRIGVVVEGDWSC